MKVAPGLFVAENVLHTLETACGEYNQGLWENNPALILAFYEKWTTLDFEERDNPKGAVTSRQEMLALMEQVVSLGSLGGFDTVLKAKSIISELAIGADSATARVTNKYRYSQADAQGWYGLKDAKHEIEFVGRWRETWVMTEEGWRLQINQLISNQTFVDGVLFCAK